MDHKAIAFLVLLALVSPAAYAVNYNVGGNSGWTNGGVNYDNWARGQTFVVGDTLVFTYDSSHAVDEVTSPNYQSCSSQNSINSNSTSPTIITLSTPSTRYFICPRSNHCNQGMRLTVTTTASNGTTTPSTPPGTTPSTPPGTPSGTRSPPPPSNGATCSFGGRDGLMVGLSLAVAALL